MGTAFEVEAPVSNNTDKVQSDRLPVGSTPAADMPRPTATFRRIALLLCLGVSALGTSQAAQHALVISGLGGTAEYSEAFQRAGEQFTDGLQTLVQQKERIVHLDESATRDDILQAIETVAEAVAADASKELATTFTLVLIGHGTANAQTWQFNITGPDLTTEDLVAALNDVQASQQVVVLGASASGAALDALAQPQRLVVTATKSGGEKNAVHFPAYLAEAVASDVADYDRNEILTVAEAFRFAQSRTVAHFEEKKLLASEHARLRGERATDVALARLGSLKMASDDPVVSALLEERLVLEEAFKQLTSEKSSQPIADYYNKLETLLISIAELQQSIDKATGWSETDAES